MILHLMQLYITVTNLIWVFVEMKCASIYIYIYLYINKSDLSFLSNSQGIMGKLIKS